MSEETPVVPAVDGAEPAGDAPPAEAPLSDGADAPALEDPAPAAQPADDPSTLAAPEDAGAAAALGMDAAPSEPAAAPLAGLGAAPGGPNVGPGGLTVRAYLDTTVVPVLRKALRELVKQRPADPYEFLAQYILDSKPR